MGNAHIVCGIPAKRLTAEAAKIAPPYQLIVFDLDGTLFDSRRDIAESANALLETCGARPLPEETIGRLVGDGAATLIARAFAAAGIDRPADALDRFLAIYDTRLLNHTRPYSQVPEVLETLGARTPLAMLTNKPLRATRTILSGLDLARLIYDFTSEQGFPVVRVTVWETPTSFAEYRRLER